MNTNIQKSQSIPIRRNLMTLTKVVVEKFRRKTIQIQTTILPLRRAPLVVKQCLALTLIYLITTEIPSWINDWFPTWAHYAKKDWCLWPGFELATPYQRVWMLSFSATDIQKCCGALIVTKLAKQYSVHLFLISVLVLAFCILDGLMLWINFKTWHLFYADMIFTILILAKGVFKEYSPETISKVKSLF